MELTLLFAIVGSSLFFIGAERFFPYQSSQSLFRSGFWTDLIGYGLLQSYAMGLLIAWLGEHLKTQVGVSLFLAHYPISLSGQVLFFLLLHDLNTYLIHRMQHSFHFLWKTHEAHHSTPEVDWLSGIRSSAVEILIYESAKFIPMILLGADREVFLIRAWIDSTWGMFIHSNLNVRLGWLGYLLNGPELHRWHHAKYEPKAYHKNFSTKFSIWDFLFSTAFKPQGQKAHEYGVEDPHYPRDFISQQLLSFGVDFRSKTFSFLR